jgi:hypothetical protein
MVPAVSLNVSQQLQRTSENKIQSVDNVKKNPLPSAGDIKKQEEKT